MNEEIKEEVIVEEEAIALEETPEVIEEEVIKEEVV